MRKVIWSCWFQGREHAPEVVTRCMTSWETRNPAWVVRCLDAKTVRRYLEIDGYINLNSQTITPASLSDIVRILLLHEYGGVWTDATVYCNRPLDGWLPLAMQTGFFAFSKPAPDRPLSSWLLAAEPANALIAKWAARTIEYWKGRTASDDYFWFHHLFAELCATDTEARAAWERVPKISSDGPHSIQRVGMDRRAEEVRREIDWTVPVFKLTHRLNSEALTAGSLLDLVLHRHDHRKPQSTVHSQPRLPLRIASLKVGTENVGDHIQILAGQRLIKRFGFFPDTLIDRDEEIASARLGTDQQYGILLNGWFKTNQQEWPPHPNLLPIYLGFHIRLFQAPSLLSEAAIRHYRKYSPIGCRDRYTLSLLEKHGIDAFLSHCVSLSLARRLPDPHNQTETFVVSRDERILDYLPKQIRPFRFISHYSGSSNFEANVLRAKELLSLYRTRARLIVTTMLHCALPAVAMGIPVVVFFPPNVAHQHQSDSERFSSLQEMMRVFHPSEATLVDWEGYSVDVGDIKLALLDQLAELTKRWGHSEIRELSPIASSTVLAVPCREKLAHHIEDPRRQQLLAETTSPDRQRWGNPDCYKTSWDDRAAAASALIPSDCSVLEIGVGAGNLRRLIEQRCRYVGADLVPLASDVRALDIESDPLPHESYDCIAALGVFEYLHCPHRAAVKIASATERLVLSYCCMHDGSHEAIEERKKRGWVSHMAETTFVAMFLSQGFHIEERVVHSVNDDFEQLIFAFRRQRQSSDMMNKPMPNQAASR